MGPRCHKAAGRRAGRNKRIGPDGRVWKTSERGEVGRVQGDTRSGGESIFVAVCHCRDGRGVVEPEYHYGSWAALGDMSDRGWGSAYVPWHGRNMSGIAYPWAGNVLYRE